MWYPQAPSEIWHESQLLKALIFFSPLFSMFCPLSPLSTLCAPLDGLCQLNDLKTSGDGTQFHFSLQHQNTKEIYKINNCYRKSRMIWHNFVKVNHKVFRFRQNKRLEMKCRILLPNAVNRKMKIFKQAQGDKIFGFESLTSKGCKTTLNLSGPLRKLNPIKTS